MSESELSFEAELEHEPQTVWRALTEPDLLAAWLPANDDGAPGEVLAADEPNSISYAWKDARDAREQVVTFVLAPAGAGTRLTVLHEIPVAAGRPVMRMESLKWAA